MRRAMIEQQHRRRIREAVPDQPARAVDQRVDSHQPTQRRPRPVREGERAIESRPDQLVRAAEKNSLEAVALLIELGFDPNTMNRTAPLHEAAMRGNIRVIRLLLEHGADPNLRDVGYKATPASRKAEASLALLALVYSGGRQSRPQKQPAAACLCPKSPAGCSKPSVRSARSSAT
jgi:hypothetical protein